MAHKSRGGTIKAMAESIFWIAAFVLLGVAGIFALSVIMIVSATAWSCIGFDEKMAGKSLKQWLILNVSLAYLFYVCGMAVGWNHKFHITGEWVQIEEIVDAIFYAPAHDLIVVFLLWFATRFARLLYSWKPPQEKDPVK